MSTDETDSFFKCQQELRAFNQFILHGAPALESEPLKLLGVNPTLVQNVIDALKEFPTEKSAKKIRPTPNAAATLNIAPRVKQETPLSSARNTHRYQPTPVILQDPLLTVDEKHGVNLPVLDVSMVQKLDQNNINLLKAKSSSASNICEDQNNPAVTRNDVCGAVAQFIHQKNWIGRRATEQPNLQKHQRVKQEIPVAVDEQQAHRQQPVKATAKREANAVGTMPRLRREAALTLQTGRGKKPKLLNGLAQIKEGYWDEDQDDDDEDDDDDKDDAEDKDDVDDDDDDVDDDSSESEDEEEIRARLERLLASLKMKKRKKSKCLIK